VSAGVSKRWTDDAGVLHEGACLASVGGFDVVECLACGFAHALPLPSVESLTTVYSHEYYSTEKPLYIERYLEDRHWWDSVYDARLSKLEKFLEPSRRRLLDVGSGPGLFLARAEQRGWRVRGIEPSSAAAAFSRDSLGLDVSQEFLDARTAGGLGKFDALNLALVLEHLPDPRRMLRLCFDLLEPAGVICVIAPNDFNPFQQAVHEQLGQPTWWVVPPHHLNFFNRHSLQRLLDSEGFEVLHSEATFPIDLFLLMGDNYVGDDALGRQCHQRRKAFELNLIGAGRMDLLDRLYAAFSALDLGRELVFFARKR
jgi:SAM-dependent methyltransferase